MQLKELVFMYRLHKVSSPAVTAVQFLLSTEVNFLTRSSAVMALLQESWIPHCCTDRVLN